MYLSLWTKGAIDSFCKLRHEKSLKFIFHTNDPRDWIYSISLRTRFNHSQVSYPFLGYSNRMDTLNRSLNSWQYQEKFSLITDIEFVKTHVPLLFDLL
jgi:hypothetical protein